MLPLGIRNKNPLNIRYSKSNPWRGQTGSNKGFCVFSSLIYGYRAALVLVKNYVKNGNVTISSIVSRWAPESENDTQAYIRTVIQHFHRLDDDLFNDVDAHTNITSYISQDTSAIILELVWIMSLIECGYPKGFDYQDNRKHVVRTMFDALCDAYKLVFPIPNEL